MKQPIGTGDKFGVSTEVIDAIERAHRDGILNTANLVVNPPADTGSALAAAAARFRIERTVFGTLAAGSPR